MDRCPRCGATLPAGRLEVCPRCLLEPEDAAPARIGEAIVLEEEIGRGGMGRVYKARHLRLGRAVAVKLLPPEAAGNPVAQARIEREARALALLDHPNIVRVHDAGGEGGHAYVVMELVEGRSLSAEAPLAPRRALEIARQVCDALAYAHARGVIHRDVKPANLLLNAMGVVKVVDFGIGRLAAPGERGLALTAEGSAIGTPPYMAPEALAGAPASPSTDVYSLGASLYELVTGRPAAGDLQTLADPALDRIVRRALAPDPERRYPSAEAMRRDVEEALARGAPDDLAAEERQWIRAAALVHTIATAIVLWALVLSLTPREIHPEEALPLVVLGVERLEDGRLLSRARFETWPMLAALAAAAGAIGVHGLLRRHLRRAGLDRARPDRPVRQSRAVFAAGGAAGILYAVRLVLETRSPALSRYLPIAGGMIEIAALWLFWLALLEAWRTSRPLSREPLLLAGMALALAPPSFELVRYLVSWEP